MQIVKDQEVEFSFKHYILFFTYTIIIVIIIFLYIASITLNIVHFALILLILRLYTIIDSFASGYVFIIILYKILTFS